MWQTHMATTTAPDEVFAIQISHTGQFCDNFRSEKDDHATTLGSVNKNDNCDPIDQQNTHPIHPHMRRK